MNAPVTAFLRARLDEEILVRWAAAIRAELPTLTDQQLRFLASIYADHPDCPAEIASEESAQ